MSNRIKFIINTSADFFNTTPTTDDFLIKEFLENDEIHILSASIQKHTIVYQHRIPVDDNCLLFYKIPTIGSQQFNNQDDNHQSIGLITLEGGILKSIYNSISRVFSPQASKRSDYTPEITKIIENLQISLGASLGLPDSGIHNIQDEINFWMQKIMNSPTKSDKESAKMFVNSLNNLQIQIKALSNSSLNSIDEILEVINNILDELWRLPCNYPQNRMSDLMDIICINIIDGCIENLANEDIWNLNSFHISTILTQVKEITDTWIQLCDSLTRLFWPNYMQHPWVGEPHETNLAKLFNIRLNEIKNIKNMYKQIMIIFRDDEYFGKNVTQMFLPFRDINIFDTSPFGQKRWMKSITLFEGYLDPVEERIANILKTQIHQHYNNPRQIVHIFLTFDVISKRPTILELLTAEREHFLQSLNILLKDLKNSLIQKNDTYDVGDISPLVAEARWLKIVEYQITEIENISHMLQDRDGYDALMKNLENIKNEIQSLLKVSYNTWCEQSYSSVRSGELTLRDDKPVVEFEKQGRQLMRVTFNLQLVSFCNDVREYENLGYAIPNELRKTATHALRFINFAKLLQQIATFHNTIGDRMIPCQRPIMLKNAVELSKLVQSQSVAWNDEESVRQYVSVLQTAVSKLSNDNTLLLGYHEQMKKTVIKLINTDLIRQAHIWKDEMRFMRENISTLERQGYQNLNAFKTHWDYQLYKVLECQYLNGLLDLNHKLPDITVDIVFRQQQLQFRPPIEEIQSKYYSQLRKFIERPLGFRGLSDQSGSIFKVMVKRNGHYFKGLYNRSVDLFKQLNLLRDAWLPWVALGCVELDKLCNVHLSVAEDWEINFKACKQFSQDIAKIQDGEERLDCFVINISPLRSDIEFISRTYWEALSFSLRSSILQDISTLQDFVQTSLQVLQNVPMDETGIAEAGAKYEKIVNEMSRMEELIKIVRAKDNCLASWCKERVSALSGIVQQWEKLQPLIDNHHSVLQRQIDMKRDHVSGQISNMHEETEKFLFRWEATLTDIENNENSDLAMFRDRKQQWISIKEKFDFLKLDCEKFNIDFPKTVIELFEKVENDVKQQGEQWDIYEQFGQEFDDIAIEEWTVYRKRPYIFTTFLSKWAQTESMATSIAASRIRLKIDLYQSVLPVLQALQSDALIDKHWAKIFTIFNIVPKPYHDIILKDILSATNLLEQHAVDIQNIVRQAESEQVVRQALIELDQWGVVAMLKITPHNDCKGETLMIIKEFQDVLNKIGDNQSLLQSAKNSAAFEAFSDQAEIWEGRLNSLDHILTCLNLIQRKWIYLEPIFGAGTLKNEAAIFVRIDKDFRYIMTEITKDTRVLSVSKINNITTIINSLENQLQRCQKTLSSYITAKRNAFPRFYFLGDDDLLEILGQSTKEFIIQKHIKKLFPGIHHLGLTKRDGVISIKSIHSAEGDNIELKEIVTINNIVEEWLNNLVLQITETLKSLFNKCHEHEELTLEHIKKYPIQILYLSKSITFTKKTERAITSMTLQNHLKQIKEEILQYTILLKNSLDNLLQIKVRGILLDLVHYATIIEYLLKHNVTNHKDWHWLQQLKFYMNRDNKVVIRMVYAEFEYSYEYLGNFNKLVNTSLTHKCYLTLTQAMHLGLGGNPFGPAGTGKTECVKALGAMLGRLVLVFNCDENVDASAMGLILSGLARCGAWGCFDEFNRLEEATLSTISMMIQPIQTALKNKLDTLLLNNETIPLSALCGIFVTLNPASEDYGGRQKLPGNLQDLFRPVVMQQPEPQEIARVLLFVEGFRSADQIGDRMVELFHLADKILSKQRHYDWGLRELKTVLSACGNSLRNNKESPTVQEENEIAVLALRSNTMSKLTQSDCKRFDMLINDVFSNVSLHTTGQTELRNTIDDVFSSLGLQANQRQSEKCIQLYEQLLKRMGVVIIGPSCSGKTSLISILKQALTTMGKTIRTYTISPKSMTREQLLGKLDPDTRQWIDGVLTTTAVAVNSEPQEISSWIICDGDIDPEWIEALNSVLDDNRLLSLPSGWRIQFEKNVNFIFETHDLSHASPATISRMGIINLSSEDLNESLIIDSWLIGQSDIDITKLLVEQYFDKTVDWLIQHNNYLPFEQTKVSLYQSGLQMIYNAKSKEEFCIGLLNGLGSVLNIEFKNEFAKYVFNNADIYIPDMEQAEYYTYNTFREKLEIYEQDNLLDDSFDKNKLIRTPAVKVNSEILRNLLRNKINPMFLISGPAGSGKTLLLNNIVSEFSGYQLVTINCSAQLTANYVLYTLRQNFLIVSGVRGREYKPRLKKLIIYFKNIDLCPNDSWGTSDVIELILQINHRHGFYSESLEWISISGVQICGTILNTNKQNISPRFLATAKLLVTGYPSDNDMKFIIRNQIGPIFKKIQNSTNTNIDRIVDAFINIYSQTRNSFTIEDNSHYIFTPKMVTNWIYNLINYPDDYLPQATIYEARKIFRDRLCTEAEAKTFDDILVTQMRYVFNVTDDVHFFVPHLVKSSTLQYTTYDQWNTIVEKNISICNSENILIELPITTEFLDMTAAISRVLSRSGAHLVISSSIGSGYEEALYVASTNLHIKVFTPQTNNFYNLNDFYNDLKLIMQAAALEDLETVFFINHAWITIQPDILKPIEAILEGSDIPDLFGDDLEAVANPLRNAAQMDGYQESLASYFLKRVKTNLHIVIFLESSSRDLQELFIKFPALYRATEMYWLHSLSKNTLEALPTLINTKTAFKDTSVPPYFTEIILKSGKWSQSPKRHIQLILSYQQIYKKFMHKNKTHYDKLKIGIDKLSAAETVVATLKDEAKLQEVALGEKRKLAAQALEMISATMRNATDQRTDLLELKKKTQDSSEKLIERKKAIELELREVEPLLKEASAAVGQIKTEALSEIRSLRAPPEAIRDILEGVLRLMGIRDTSWNSMKSFLAKRGIKEDIKSLDPGRISSENCQAVEKLLQSKSESFDNKNAKRASAAAAPLACWVIANVKYSKVMQSIKPLEREQNELQRNLNDAETHMKSLMTGLEDVNSRVNELSTQLNSYTQEAAFLEIKLEEARKTLKAAEDLVSKLSSEYDIWSKEMTDLKIDLNLIDLKTLMTGLCLTHFSHCVLDIRNHYLEKISTELDTATFIIDQQLSNDQDKLLWESMGLTPDTQSMQNAALVRLIIDLPFRCTPIPLLIDPSTACNKWLQEFLITTGRAFELTTQSADRFTYTLELAVRFGKILVIQDSHVILPALLSLILSPIYTRFNKKLLQVGNKLIDLHDDFNIILVTQLDKVDLSIEIESYITTIMFTTTASGLTDQLMSKSILFKRPELEEKRINLLQNEGRLWKQRLELQDSLLHELSSAQGDILKNESLLSTLNDVKESSKLIDKSLQESTEIRAKLMLDYNQFKSICNKAANFYIEIGPIYKMSVDTFTDMFLLLMREDDIDEIKTYRKFIRLTYETLCRSVPKSNHLSLVLNIAKNAFTDLIPEKEWELFVTNFMTGDDLSGLECPAWIKKEQIPKILSIKLSTIDFYNSLSLEKEDLWKSFIKDNKSDIPVKITDFQKVLITQILRPDLMLNTLINSATKILGLSTLSVSQPTVQKLLNESKPDEPMLLIAKSGTDPSKDLSDYAKQNMEKDKYIELSVGKGQENQALVAIKEAANLGQWICLKNVHLVKDWLKQLNAELKCLKLSDNFKLWLTCETTDGFCDIFMQKCCTILYEPPNGIKHKIQRLLLQWEKIIKQKRDPKIVKLYIALLILNAVLEERRTYIPQGWCKSYDFSDADLRAAIEFISWIEKTISMEMDWSILRGLCQQVAYGGRIDNSQDLEILICHLEDFFDSKIMQQRWTPLKINLNLPQSNNIQDYQTALAQLPETDLPEYFGLSSKCNISRDLTFCRNLLKELRSTYFKNDDQENYDKRLRPVLSYWKKLSGGSSLLRENNQLKDTDDLHPWKSFILSELILARKLMITIHKTLVSLHSVIKNNAFSISKEETLIMINICENQIPFQWKQIWSGPKQATEYMKAVFNRSTEAEHRYLNTKNELFCEEINFSKIFNVDAFLAALKLTTGRENQQSACDLCLTTSFNILQAKQNTLSVRVAPLNMDGAEFSNGKLIISNSNNNNTSYEQTKTSAFDIMFVKKSLSQNENDVRETEIPLYTNVTRERFICAIKIPTNIPKPQIVYAGIALVVPDTA